MKYANLHLHSIYSDGVYTPRELCEKARSLGYGAIALTDHDTFAGYGELAQAADELGLEHTVGVEFVAQAFGESFHIVGLGFDPENKALLRHSALLRENAMNKAKAKFEALASTKPFSFITWDEVVANAPEGATFCNEQIFASLAKRGLFSQESFWDYFFIYKAMRVTYPKNSINISAEHVISLIRNAGGVAILAHPHGQTCYLERLVRLGLTGVECDHPELSDADKIAARAFAEKNSLYISGGTDHTGRLGDFTDKRGDKPYAAELAGDSFYCPLSFDAKNGITKEEFDRIKMRICG